MVAWLGELGSALSVWALVYVLVCAGVLLAFAPRDFELADRWKRLRRRVGRRRPA